MIPIVDISTINIDIQEPGDDALKSVGTEIMEAFQTIGVCYISNHGVSEAFIEECMAVSREFFNQPEPVKSNFEKTKEKLFGWLSIERETLNPDRPADLKESFDFKPCEFTKDWQHDQHFRKGNFSLFENSSSLTIRICDALSLALGLDRNFFRNVHKYIGDKENETVLRTLFYPPLGPDKIVQPGQIRCGEHTDYGTITLLFQDSCGGLEVKIPEKGYVPAPPIPGTILINIGSLMQRWTADDLLATEHRVIIPEAEVTKRKCRQSMTFFVNPDNETVIECIDGSNKYKPVTSLEYLLSRLYPTY